MGRSISQTAAGVSVISPAYNPSGVFGSGVISTFATSGTFVVPTGVTSVRVRCFGGGGGGSAEYTSGGAGGTSSFGAYVSATGGTGATGRGASQFEPGGNGSGGDINFTGGNGRSSGSFYNQAGGGVASYFGDGGNSGYVGNSSQDVRGGSSTGGAGGGGYINSAGGQTAGGAGFMSQGAFQKTAYSTTPGVSVPAQQPPGQGWSVDMYGTGGGGAQDTPGINGGGGGGRNAGSFPGGGSAGSYGGGGGGGFALKTITGLTPGTSISVTVGSGGNGPSNSDPFTAPAGARGLVVVEY